MQALLHVATWTRLQRAYRRIFNIGEIETNPVLQWILGASTFFFLLTFDVWINSASVLSKAGNGICWPYAQGCESLFFLERLPLGYSQSTFYMALYAVLILIVWRMWRKDWTGAHMLLLPLFLFKFVTVMALAFSEAAPYHYYHLILTAILLFTAHKEFFLKIGFVSLYFMSVTTKFDSTWILGSYFTAMKNGLPLLPDYFAPVFTNFVIFMQVIGAWFLLSRNWILQRLSLAYMIIFHLYSGVLVLYLYPSVSLPALIILFGPMYRHTSIPFRKTAIVGWFIILLVAIFQLLGFIAPGDRRITLEGNRFGMFMFEANHQCVATTKSYSGGRLETKTLREVQNGTPCSGFFCLVSDKISVEDGHRVQERRFESGTAWNRCDPYIWWSRLRKQCASNDGINRIALQFDHSINGGPFFRIVDVLDICSLDYRTFGHNDWILRPPESPIVGYPVENSYHY